MKQKKRLNISKATERKNALYINKSTLENPSNFEISLELENEEKEKVEKHFHKLSLDNNRAWIVLKFKNNGQANYREDKAEDIEYQLLSYPAGSREDQGKDMRKADYDYLLRRLSSGFSGGSVSGNFGEDIEYKITNNTGEIYVILTKKNEDSKQRIIKGGNVEVRSLFYLTQEIDPTELIEAPPLGNKEPKKPWYKRPLLVTFLLILGVLLVLAIAFHQKILKWIKGETKQEKKIKEQLDIF